MPKISKIRPEDVEAIAERMRALRATTGLSQELFAEKYGLGYSQWGNIEGGTKGRIGLDAALVLAKKMRVPLDWIYLGETAWLPAELREKIEYALANPAPLKAKRVRKARQVARATP